VERSSLEEPFHGRMRFARRKTMIQALARLVREDDGQDLFEYAFLAIFIALAVTVGLQSIASGLDTHFSNLGTQVSSGS
jgi:Flp pilus assembly pilin Flp